MKLYDLTDAYARVQHLAEEGSPEDWNYALSDIRDGIEQKCDNICKVIVGLQVDADAFTVESKRLRVLADQRATSIQNLKQYMKANLEGAAIQKVKGQFFTVSVDNSPPKCSILDEALIPDEFKEQVITCKIDARGIIAQWKETNEQVPGAVVSQDKYIRIRS